MTWKEMDISGWGRSSTAHVLAARPERPREIETLLTESGAQRMLARGAGRSYGDAAQIDGGRVVLTSRLNRLLSFDPGTGDVACEPGVTFADLLDVFLERGFMPPASPGTAFATVGGAVAADVHGKNHDRHGSFGDHIRWIDLMLADGTSRRVTAESDPELFAATIGGMGLTGFIRGVGFRMLPAAWPMVTVTERRMANLERFLEAFREVRETAMFSVGWIDALARGHALGRGILETAEFMAGDAPAKPRKSRTVPFNVPGIALNRLSVHAFNAMYFKRVPEAGRQRTRPLAEFLYPLDSLLEWHRIYGKRGFYQFQAVVPDETAPGALRQMLETISETGNPSFLAVLKTLGRAGRGMLSFPMRGHTLALDFPRTMKADALLLRLEAITRDAGGRIYLAKDARLTREGFRAMYPELPRFERVLQQVDPLARWSSDQARRLGIGGRS